MPGSVAYLLLVVLENLFAEQVSGSGALHLGVVFAVQPLQGHVGGYVGQQLNQQGALLDAQHLRDPSGRLGGGAQEGVQESPQSCLLSGLGKPLDQGHEPVSILGG